MWYKLVRYEGRELAKADEVDCCMTAPNQWLREALDVPEGNTPFPWQEELFARFVSGTIERALDIPTGLGKTAVMAIWLVARACGAKLPGRLVYVVDRRAVVDQATEVAKGLRGFVDRTPGLREKLGLGDHSLPISTLRGQYVDNKEWLEDPASLAIIVGTVDMIGSRLLFEGYGTSRKMRPYHAGLLGADTLVVLDEAHLVPPFEKLLEAIAEGAAVFGPRDEALREIVPSFKLLSLSATGRAHSGESFGLQEADLEHPEVGRRLVASKCLTVLPPINDPKELTNALAGQAWKLAGDGTRAVRCIVFCDKRKDAEAVNAAIEKLAKGVDVAVDTELFVGGRRVFEREEAARWLRERGFIAGSKVERLRPMFVTATSAGEVGVDLDADHMVSDLVAWERMVQRLGRVNRRGDGEALVMVVAVSPSKDLEKARAKAPEDRSTKDLGLIADAEREAAVRQLISELPLKENARDASPGALRDLKLRAQKDRDLQAILDTATTPAPLRPALSRALVDAWSMTSLEEHTGRPEIDPWLRGWIENDPPQTAVVWRTHLPVRTRGTEVVPPAKKDIEAFFEAAPPHASEVLETETFRVVEWLASRAKASVAASNVRTSTSSDEGENDEDAVRRASICRDDVAAVALTAAGDLGKVLTLNDLEHIKKDYDEDARKAKQAKKPLGHLLHGATLVVDVRLAGLTDGLLNDEEQCPPRAVDDGKSWMEIADATSTLEPPVVRFRVRTAEAERPLAVDAQWLERLRFTTKLSDDGEPSRWLIVEKWRHDSTTEEDRSAGRPQLLDDHQKWAEECARALARRLDLPDAYVDMLATAALVHDEGKRAKRWQRAFNARSDGDYAKTLGPLNTALLDGYRHEFGSLLSAEEDARLLELPDDLRDLGLHLIAAHHGFARPIIRTDACERLPPSALEQCAAEAARRFARLQKRWGPWGLAWWESLLRAADQQASRDNDAADSTAAKKSAR